MPAVAMPAPCPRFVQNAWKRDLCSNCFKAKDEHAPEVDLRARYLASLSEITKLPPPPSILKGVNKKNVSAFKVHFPTEESQVIGYGGDELSDYEEEEDHRPAQNCSPVEEDPAEEEAYRNFQKLTECNTEFNKDPSNLSFDSVKSVEVVKKTTLSTPLKLGQVSTDGKKQTLLVSVQPFGSPAASTTPLAVSRKTHLNNLLHDAADSLKLPDPCEAKEPVAVATKKEIPLENKTDACDETVRSGEVKITSSSITSSMSQPEELHVNNIVVDSVPSSNEEIVTVSEQDNLKTDENDSYKKTEHAENRLSSLIEGKKNQITRGTILTKTHEQAKTKRHFQLGPISPDEELPVSESLYKKLQANQTKLKPKFSNAKDTISIKTSIQQKNMKNSANNLFSSKLLKKEFGPQSDLQLTKMKSLDVIDMNMSAINHNSGLKKSEEVLKNKPALVEAPTISFIKIPSLDEAVAKDEVVVINGIPTESREMAGEPDGRADSDDTDEPPPELPTTPPPPLSPSPEHAPRPSFLHSVSREKPKLPAKPKLREKSPPADLALDSVTAADPSLSPSGRQSLLTKRQAPKPPPTPTTPTPSTNQDRSPSPPLLHCERASSCSPQHSGSEGSCSPGEESIRGGRRMSEDALATPSSVALPGLDKKKGNKMRSTLRKFLRLASREELTRDELGPPPVPPPRPRLEIIHPLDLNKSGVQVLRSDGSVVTAKHVGGSPETPSSPTSTTAPMGFQGRPSKPPPPPRSLSLDAMGMGDLRPARPPPPSRDLVSTQRLTEPSLLPSQATATQSVYVNLGEVRSTIVPSKPQRSASLREKDSADASPPSPSTPPQLPSAALQTGDNMYESVEPECDLSQERTSLPYYGSETESDIYCPYTFATTGNGSGNDGVETRPRKAESKVHKSLEDNYSAVVAANHEALTQLLDQASPGPPVLPGLRPLRSATAQWADFTVDDSSGREEVGGRVFLRAHWSHSPVSLCLSPGQTRLPACFAPITQFFDLVASQFLHHEKTELVQVSVAVLARQQFLSLSGYVGQLSSAADLRQTTLVAVQALACLRTLETQGRRTASLRQAVLCRDDAHSTPRVCFLPDDSDCDKAGQVSLNTCAVQLAEQLRLPSRLLALLRDVLTPDKPMAAALAQAQAALELWFWGPSQLHYSAESQGSLQWWLDLERATVLHSLAVSRPLALSCADYCQLSFLVRTNARALADALALLNASATSS